jgi:ribosomal protein S18 acetylase RimI-like enzyme
MTIESTLQINHATIADMAKIQSIIGDYVEAINVMVRDSQEQLETYLQKDSGIWLACDDGKTIGCVVLRPLPQRENACEVKRLYVKTSHRGQGIAEALMNALEDYALSQGYQSIYLDTKHDLKAAIRFYERRGYEICERYNDNPQATLFMKRELTPSIN